MTLHWSASSHKSFEISVGSSSRVKFLRDFISSGM
jgi:hypothetical protein